MEFLIQDKADLSLLEPWSLQPSELGPRSVLVTRHSYSQPLLETQGHNAYQKLWRTVKGAFTLGTMHMAPEWSLPLTSQGMAFRERY